MRLPLLLVTKVKLIHYDEVACEKCHQLDTNSKATSVAGLMLTQPPMSTRQVWLHLVSLVLKWPLTSTTTCLPASHVLCTEQHTGDFRFNWQIHFHWLHHKWFSTIQVTSVESLKTHYHRPPGMNNLWVFVANRRITRPGIIN